MKWKRVDFVGASITVGKSKTRGGTGRLVPLNATALETLKSWRSEFPHAHPEHYVFPSESYALVGKLGLYGGTARLDKVIPTQPVSTWKTAWTTIRKRTGVKCRWHDLRHTCASGLGAGGARDQTMKSIMGWMSPKMIERYSHVSNEDKRVAVDALSPKYIQ